MVKAISVLIILLFINPNLNYPQSSFVYKMILDGSINPATENYVITSIEKSEVDHAECLIVELNTPGGLLHSTRKIVTAILTSSVPVVVFVAPEGAQSASAGVFITLAAHVAVMSPNTNIGAAHPVTMQSNQDSIMMEKATNDAAAFIKAISNSRKRNIEWAENAVRKSLSITESEAIELNVIDLIAIDERDLLNKINGKSVLVKNQQQIIHTTNSEVRFLPMSFQQKMLNIFSDPSIAYILFLIGFYGILFELYNPGAILPGVIGGISLILAFYALHTLPVNYAGVALIILGIILFLLEIKIISHGILSIGGIIALFLGSIMLFEPESLLETIKLSKELIIMVVLISSIFFLTVIGFGIKAQKRIKQTGVEGLLGETGITISQLSPQGHINIHGEIWSAESTEGDLPEGIYVKVTQITELKLFVKKINYTI